MASKIMVEWIEGRAAGKRLYVTRNSIKEGTVAPGKTASVIWGKSRLRIVIVIIYHVRIRIRTYVYANFRTCSFPQLLSQKPSDSCVANCRRWHCPTAEKCKNRQVSFDLYRTYAGITYVHKTCVVDIEIKTHRILTYVHFLHFLSSTYIHCYWTSDLSNLLMSPEVIPGTGNQSPPYIATQRDE